MLLLLAASWPPHLENARKEIRLKNIDGKLCARCTLKGPSGSMPANAVIDLGSAIPLVIHGRSAGQPSAGAKELWEVRFKDFTLAGLEGRTARIPELEVLTREHASELGEIPAAAVLGLPAFGDQVIELDAGKGMLRLIDYEPERNGEAIGLPLIERENGYWLTGRTNRGDPLAVKWTTRAYDTLIRLDLADIAALNLGSMNAAEYVVLRPGALPAGTDAVLGTHFLSHFRVTVTPMPRLIFFEETRKPSPAVEERDYFEAHRKKDVKGIRTFLENHPTSRLAREAGAALLDLLLEEEPADPESIEEALHYICSSLPEENRASALLELAKEWAAIPRSDALDLALQALMPGLEYAFQDGDSLAAAKIHAYLGRIRLERNELKEARRHLLSAAFGMPRDASVNLWLGELYEGMGKKARAWSRYAQALTRDDAPSEAWAGLDRLNRDPAFRKSFTMAEGERLLEGRIPAFHPPDRYEDRNAEDASEPVRLIELFTCADHPLTGAAELAFHGLSDYFGPGRVAMISYHLAGPAPDPLGTEVASSRAAYYQVEGPPSLFFDGMGPFTEGGALTEAGSLYAYYQTFCFQTDAEAAGWKLEGNFTLEETVIEGSVSVEGGADAEGLRLYAVLCEKRVMLPGANGLFFHRHVARAALSPLRGFILDRGRRTFPLRADLRVISASLEKEIEVQEDERAVAFHMRPVHIDGKGCVVTVFVQDAATNRIMIARSFEVRS